MCEKREVDERRRVAVAPLRMSRRRRRVFCDGYFEALLEQIAEVRFDTHVRQHAAENDFADTALAQLQDEIVGLWTKHPVGTDNNSLAVVDVRLEPLEPVCARPREAVET